MKRIFLFYSLFLFISLSSTKAADEFVPGATKWSDTNGNHINAHGGGVVYYNGAYYWFGENRNGKKSDGVSCYKSTDLYNWQRLGLALTPTGTNGGPEGNDIAVGRVLERPKVLYNALTNKWVMWIHWENGDHYGEARSCVAISNKIEGPYQFVNTFRPNGNPSRDQTVFFDPDDGNAYHFANINFNDMNITLLEDDFLTPTTQQNLTFVGYKFEAPSIFKVGETYYGLYSLSDGWKPTPGQTGYTNDIMGEWTRGDNFAVDANKETSYKSQSTFVLKVNGYDKAFIYMGDRWNEGDINSPYVWLPLSVRTGYPVVKWYDKWDLSKFKDVDRYKRAADIVEENTYLLLEKNSDRWVSQNSNYSLHIADDNETINLKFNIIETGKPYIYKIREIGSGKYFESVFGSLRLNVENDKPGQEWLLLLQEDGYYKIKNTNDDKYFAINGASTFANSGVYLSDANRAKSFGVYFDSKNFDYEAADIYSVAYREEIQELVAEQKEYLNSLTSISVVNPDAGPATIQVYSIGGQLIYTQANYIGNSNLSADLTEKLNAGVYLVKSISDNRATVQKIIVK
jgi:hypothetical protein